MSQAEFNVATRFEIVIMIMMQHVLPMPMPLHLSSITAPYHALGIFASCYSKKGTAITSLLVSDVRPGIGLLVLVHVHEL